MSIEQLQENAGWSIGRKRVRRWLEAVKPIFALLIRAELSSQVVVGLVLRILKIVLSIARRLPEVENSIGDWLLSLEI